MDGPNYCQYANGPCDQKLPNNTIHKGFFVYPSEPVAIALTVQKAVRELQAHSSKQLWQTWENLKIAGQIVFCEICRAIRGSDMIAANITTLNFNVLFELGFAIGLRKPVVPVRDFTYSRDRTLFDQVGLFDVLGYQNFTNSTELRSAVTKKHAGLPLAPNLPDINRRQPIYYIKSHIDTDGSLKLTSCLKKSAFRFRTFDSREIPRLSLHEAFRQVHSSFSIVTHLMDPNRDGANVHNSRCAFIAGMALAAGKHVLMLQEGIEIQPIDYRDVVIPYTDVSSIPGHVERLVRATADSLAYVTLETKGTVARSFLEKTDLGDVAAENEIQALSRYFVKTPQYQQAAQGHARLVVGRKGSGKTAIFYGVRKAVSHRGRSVVLDLKPEGHQFLRLKEIVLDRMTHGVQEHLLTAFWNYILLLEIAKKLLDLRRATAYANTSALQEYEELQSLYKKHTTGSEGDFSERLMSLVNKMAESFPSADFSSAEAAEITNRLYSLDIRELAAIVARHLSDFDGLWLLFDNIDKGWPTCGATVHDIAILRCLLEATRKLQRSLGTRQVEFKTVICIRKDIHDLLVDHTPDRGKESFVNLDWSDVELVKELVRRRLGQEFDSHEPFADIWTRLFDPHVAGEDSFRYLCSRTLMRPRDILNFVGKCVQVAVSRDHTRVEQEDILVAERQFSEDMLNDLRYEIRDVFPQHPTIVHRFLGAKVRLSKEDLQLIFMDADVPETKVQEVTDALLWFCFLGVSRGEEGCYSYEIGYDLLKLKSYVQSDNQQALVYIVHPAFRTALDLQ